MLHFDCTPYAVNHGGLAKTAGYARIVLALASFYLMLSNPWLAVSLYLTSVILDEFDGRAARKYNQCTNFGGLLDVITDM